MPSHEGRAEEVVRDPRAQLVEIGGAAIRLVAMIDADIALLNEVVSRARTDSGQVVIPADLFQRIQARIREVEEARDD